MKITKRQLRQLIREWFSDEHDPVTGKRDPVWDPPEGDSGRGEWGQSKADQQASSDDYARRTAQGSVGSPELGQSWEDVTQAEVEAIAPALIQNPSQDALEDVWLDWEDTGIPDQLDVDQDAFEEILFDHIRKLTGQNPFKMFGM